MGRVPLPAGPRSEPAGSSTSASGESLSRRSASRRAPSPSRRRRWCDIVPPPDARSIAAGEAAITRRFGAIALPVPEDAGPASTEARGELLVAADARPAGGVAPVQVVADRRIGSCLDEQLHRSGLPALRCEVERGDAFAVRRSAEGAAAIRIGAELEEPPDRVDAPVRGRPRQRRAAVRIGVEVRAELDESRDRGDAVALRRPHKRLVEDLLRVVRRRPGGEAAVVPVELAVRAGGRSAGELVDQVDAAEPGGDAEVPRRLAEQWDDLAVAPEERLDERRAAVAAGREIGARAGGEEQARELDVVSVAGLVELRPPVVVAAVDVRTSVEQKPDELEVARHPEEVVAVRAADADELGMPVEQLGEPHSVAALEGAVREHERRRRLDAVRERFDVTTELGPAFVAVPRREVAPRLDERYAADARDAVCTFLVVVEIGSERLLEIRDVRSGSVHAFDRNAVSRRNPFAAPDSCGAERWEAE